MYTSYKLNLIWSYVWLTMTLLFSFVMHANYWTMKMKFDILRREHIRFTFIQTSCEEKPYDRNTYSWPWIPKCLGTFFFLLYHSHWAVYDAYHSLGLGTSFPENERSKSLEGIFYVKILQDIVVYKFLLLIRFFYSTQFKAYPF